MVMNIEVEAVREWLRRYIGTCWTLSTSTRAITLGYLAEIDDALPQRLLEIADELGVSDQIINDLI